MESNGAVQRTEAQKLAQAPVEVMLGGKHYEVKLLSIKASAEWRRRAAEVIGETAGFWSAQEDDRSAVLAGIRGLMSGAQDRIAELFFNYAKELPRETIEQEATDQELACAFDKVIAVAFPLGRSLASLMRMGQSTP